MIRTIIVDDEPLARKGIRQFLSRENDFKIIAENEDGISALETIESLKPDLVFLDIQMPELDGFEVLSNLKEDTLPLIIFVTAFDEYALKAFQAHAVDYLTKPLDEAHFKKALKRVRLLIKAQHEANYTERLQNLIREIGKKPEFAKRFLVKEKNKMIIIPVENVNIFKSSGDYITLLTGQEKYIIRETLTNLEQKLDPSTFIRINRSVIIRINLIKELEPISKGDYQLRLYNGQLYNLSRNYREAVLQKIQK